MKSGGYLFLLGGLFYIITGGVYYWVSREPVGTTALILTAGLAELVAFFLLFTQKRIKPTLKSGKKNLAKNIGLLPCQTPAYSPESNGMSESFVKRFKQDYVQVNELWSSNEVLLEIPKL